MNRSEGGFFFLPVLLCICIGLGAAYALLPSFTHEEFREGRRLRKEQARAAAEGAAVLALHRGTNLDGVKIGAADAHVEVDLDIDRVVATATVTGPRGVEETFTVEFASRGR